LKTIDRYDEAVARSLRLRDGLGYLLPVCELHADDTQLIRLLADWRDRNQAVFPTQFEVTLEGTRTWLRERVLDDGGRMMFLIVDRRGHLVGHVGFADPREHERSIKPDNMIRGVEGQEPGIMRAAVAAEIEWAHDALGTRLVRAPVLRGNEAALSLVRDLGFRPAGEVPLRRHRVGDHTVLRPVEPHDTAASDDAWLLWELTGKPRALQREPAGRDRHG
jgi:perosamine synthetase